MEQFTLFGLPDYIAQPKKTAHGLCGCFIESEAELKQKAIQAWFVSGKSLTVLEALKRFKTTELRKIVCRLKNKGVNIVSGWVLIDDKKHHKKYWLENKTE